MDLLLKYVDDTKALGTIMNEEDVSIFQDKLQTLYDWTKSNSMQWNEVKFNLLRLAPNKKVNRVIKNNTLLFTPEYENVISETDRVKDLGIFFDNEL